MESVTLPLLLPAASPREGLKAMRWMQRAAVIIEPRANVLSPNPRPSLIKAGEIFWGLSHQKSKLLELKTIPVYRLSVQEIRNRQLNVSDPFKTQFGYETLLDDVGFLYALVDRAGGMVKIVSRQESGILADNIQKGPQQCYCVGPYRHAYEPPPDGQTGDPCPSCPKTLHCEPD